MGETEEKIMDMARAKNIPLLTIFNKADIYNIKSPNGIRVNALDKHPNAREGFLGILKQAIASLCPPDSNNPPLLGDLVPEHSTVVMLVPIDYEAPKGRLILPQVQAIRDCLDHNQSVMVVKDNDYPQILDNFKTPPALVICDSQMVDYMVANTPTNIKCTTFSILMARYKGDLNAMTAGASVIDTLQDGDKILVAEACTHHALEDDIARVKIPRWLKQKTGKNLVIDYISGCDFINNLTEYKLVIQCGGCTINRREVLSRIRRCQAAGVAITNYGVLISALKGVLPRVLEPFKD